MKIGSMMPSTYLKKDDFPTPALLTIRSFAHANVAAQNEPEEKKWIMHFDEMEKGLVLNPTNLQLAALAMDSDDTDDWIGQSIVVYNDPNVSFGGKLTGGLRLRAPKRAKPAAAPVTKPRAAPAQTPDPRADVPFADMEDDSDPPF
jgi:hypothetical protein